MKQELQYPIELASNASHNSREICLLSGGLILVNFVVHQAFLQELHIVNMFIYGVSLALLLLGVLKNSEPKRFLRIDESTLTFYHRYGEFQCEWSLISRIDIPQINQLQGRQSFNYIGLRFDNREAFYDNFPLRLASRLLTEQRNLLLAVASNGCSTGQCVPEDFVDAAEYKMPNGRIYRGLIGMFANRCELLREHLGFQLYIPLSNSEKSPHEVLNLLKETKNQSVTVEFLPQS